MIDSSIVNMSRNNSITDTRCSSVVKVENIPDVNQLNTDFKEISEINDAEWQQVKEDGRAATQREHDLTTLEAIKAYPQVGTLSPVAMRQSIS